ncbi:MAG: sterol-binding protein [Thermotogales bacterium]|nr:sterol-binding protein [Thermotogales bacterium]
MHPYLQAPGQDAVIGSLTPGTPGKKAVLLPRLLAAPLSLLPDTIHSRLIVLALNRALVEQIGDGELDFLQDRYIVIAVRDANIKFRLTFDGNRLTICSRSRTADLTIEGAVYDFLVLLSRQEDPDTLVFQRRLVMQGDTELGLQVKNFLDGLDVETLGLYRKIEPLLKRALPLYRQVFG